MATLTLRVATLNVPESMKRGLLRDRLTRARLVGGFFIRRRIDVAAVQESGTYLERVDKERSRLKVLWAAFNNRVKGRDIGNGVIIKRRRFKARLLTDIRIGGEVDGLNLAVVRVEHRRTGFAFRFYALHKPTRRAVNANLRPVIDAKLRDLTRIDDAAGRAWIVAGDFNGPAWVGTDLGSHKVDHIRGSKHFESVRVRVVRKRRLSDHAFLIADAHVEV